MKHTLEEIKKMFEENGFGYVNVAKNGEHFECWCDVDIECKQNFFVRNGFLCAEREQQELTDELDNFWEEMSSIIYDKLDMDYDVKKEKVQDSFVEVEFILY